jgi:hypothetical protein
VLGVTDRLELEEQLPEEAARELAGACLDLDDREVDDRVDERHAGRAPLEGGGRQGP